MTQITRTSRRSWQPLQAVALFNTANYKVSGSVGLGPNAMEATPMVIDTGPGPNLIDERSVPRDWLRRMRPPP